ncbi:TetR/AcrR family transcriptional regulator [Blastococcus haudaquaticus]|uniref:Transcriptional regulator, TetR family n=1 Tax=Blastococcus haudaquaticus TaxID=1938745 RepID=A0A286GL42_9ACTN|nr:TetR/AcrR family transcriptional regulator [Blastococcus haudaquaticus]SOD95694.1 transcriptional regulator, TetR family [Blastococcus haudaquaticus]
MTETPDWRARRWAATHQRIYDGALDLFAEHGFDAVSVGQIARAAGVSVPTFYAHYASKEHLIMQLPTADDIAALFAFHPTGPVAERVRRSMPMWLASWTPEFREAQLVRWRIIAATPSLRTGAATFERITAEMITAALPELSGTALTARDAVVVNAYLSAYTAGLLAWADGNGERKPEELIEEAFDALQGF